MLQHKVTCDFFFFSLKLFYTFLFYFSGIFVTVLAVLAVNNFKDNIIGCQVESFFQTSVYANIF